MKRVIDSLRCRLVPLAVFASGYAVVWYGLALLACALIDWSRHV